MPQRVDASKYSFLVARSPFELPGGAATSQNVSCATRKEDQGAAREIEGVLVLTHGPVSLTFDEDGNVTSFTQTSQSSVDLCAVLADP
jgi:hypothetical protein